MSAQAWAVVEPAPLAFSLHLRSQSLAVGDIALPETTLLTRSLQGLRLSLLQDGGNPVLGQAWWITGVGTEHDTVFSGLTWRREIPDGGHVALGFLKSGIETARVDNTETLAIGSIGLAGAGGWLPDLALEYALTGDASGDAGMATGLRLQGQVAKLDYAIHLTGAGSDFSPLGTQVVAGRVARQISVSYRLPSLYLLDIEVRSWRATDQQDPLSARSYRAALSGPTAQLLPGIERLRLDVSYQGQWDSELQRSWSLALAGGGIDLHQWRLATGLSWQSRAAGDMQVVRYGWRLRGERSVSFDDLDAALGWRLGLSNVRGTADAWGVSAAVHLDASPVPGGWAVSLEYHHAVAAVGSPDRSGRSVMLSIAFNGEAAAFDPGRALAFGPVVGAAFRD